MLFAPKQAKINLCVSIMQTNVECEENTINLAEGEDAVWGMKYMRRKDGSTEVISTG